MPAQDREPVAWQLFERDPAAYEAWYATPRGRRADRAELALLERSARSRDRVGLLTRNASVSTVTHMSARRRASLSLLLLAAVVTLAAAGPTWAHPASGPVLVESPLPTVVPDPLTPSQPELAAAPQPLGLPWPLLVGALVAAVAARRRLRPIVAIVLVLLLGVFAFENALHSLHHGFDQKEAKGCAIATASAQLAATPVDSVTHVDVGPPPAGRTTESAPIRLVVRFLCPDQGRAPPA